jgi:hypothetical protein
MFGGAMSFDEDISTWKISNVSNFENFMRGKTYLDYSDMNLDSIYSRWSLLDVTPDITIDFGTIKYTSLGLDGRNILTSPPNNWIITDGGMI